MRNFRRQRMNNAPQANFAARRSALYTGVSAATLIGALAVSTNGAKAYNFDNDAGYTIQWDNTLHYTGALRTAGQSQAITGNANTDDGDRAFGNGQVILNRLDVNSEFDISKDNQGFRLSVEGWYDPTYANENSSDNAPTNNSSSVGQNHFNNATKTTQGQDILLGDAFVHGTGTLYDHPVTYRLGRFAQTWGETAFFGNNGISGAMAPVDVSRILQDSTAQFKDYILPQTQVTGSIGLGGGLSVAGYYKFEYRPDLYPSGQSYFGGADFVPGYGERLLAGSTPFGALYYNHGKDVTPPNYGGNFGFEAKYTTPDKNYDFGAYFLNYASTGSEIVTRGGTAGLPNGVPLAFGPAGPVFSTGAQFYQVYAQNIQLIGISGATTVGDTQFGTEITGTSHTPLQSTGVFVAPGQSINNGANAPYALGDVMHMNVNQTTILKATPFWEGGIFISELGAEHLVDVTHNPLAAPGQGVNGHVYNTNLARSNSLAFQAVFSPQWYLVLPNVDMTLNLGLAYNLYGRSPDQTAFGAGAVNRGGNASIGVQFDIDQTWTTTLAYTRFIGSAESGANATGNSPVNSFTDRDFLRFTLSHAF